MIKETNKSSHILILASELLDDIELSKLPAEALILKASRLARLTGTDEIRQWLSLELGGYYGKDPVSEKYMSMTGRWIDRNEGTGYWGPLSQQEAKIEAQKIKLSLMKTPDTSADVALIVVRETHKAMSQTANRISTYSGIRSRVLAILHNFVSSIYYEKTFENLSETIFEKYRSNIDNMISESCSEVIEKIPSVMDRLQTGNQEAISQALNTCRRILEAFADAIQPPLEEAYEKGGKKISLDASKHQNRLNYFIEKNCNSASRNKRLRQNLANLFDRVSNGIHNDVSTVEAEALFLNTYLYLGEVLNLIKETKLETS